MDIGLVHAFLNLSRKFVGFTAMSDSEDETPQLPADTLAILNEFYSEQTDREAKLNNVSQSDSAQLKEINFQENWQLSQFWYNEETSTILAKEVVRVVGTEDRVCLISCPTLYTYIKKLSPDCQVTLLEYDTRFSVYGSDYLFYDYKSPLELPRDMAGSYRLVVADPPFLSEECMTRVALTIRFLSKEKIILCTGAVMEDLLKQLLGLKTSKFKPHHQNNLANEFSCYSNYDLDAHIST